MSELADIKKRMDTDMQKIDASYSDLEFRNRLWNFIKFLGFGTSAGAVYKLLEWLMNI